MSSDRLEFDVDSTIRRVSRAKVVLIELDGDNMKLNKYVNQKHAGSAEIVDFDSLSIDDIKADIEEFRKS